MMSFRGPVEIEFLSDASVQEEGFQLFFFVYIYNYLIKTFSFHLHTTQKIRINLNFKVGHSMMNNYLHCNRKVNKKYVIIFILSVQDFSISKSNFVKNSNLLRR